MGSDECSGRVLGTKALAARQRLGFADAQLVRLPPGSSVDPQYWSNVAFDRRSLPAWIRNLLVVRDTLVRLTGLPPSTDSVFRFADADQADADQTEPLSIAGNGACTSGRTLPPPAEHDLLHVTTLVTLLGWRGRLYFAPIRLLHGAVVQSMMRRAATSAGGQQHPSPSLREYR